MSQNPKAYRVLLEDGKMVVSRHVTFDETSLVTTEASESLEILEDTESVGEASEASEASDNSDQEDHEIKQEAYTEGSQDSNASQSDTQQAVESRYPARQRRQPKGMVQGPSSRSTEQRA
ncbi:TPA: hypothetical protein ACH3X1_005411 [Trebouxia sp. C0004]